MRSSLSIIREQFQYAWFEDTRKGIIADIWQNILALTLYLYIDGCGSSKVIYQEYSLWRPNVYG